MREVFREISPPVRRGEGEQFARGLTGHQTGDLTNGGIKVHPRPFEKGESRGEGFAGLHRFG